MDKIFICSPYQDDQKKNLNLAIEYCQMACVYNKLPIAPHVYFTRVFDEETSYSRYQGMRWGKDLMQYCSEIWIFCDELTEGMIEEIAEAKKLGLKMKFYNKNRKELNHDNYLIHTEIGPAYRRIIAESFGDRFYPEGCGDCSTCTRREEKENDSNRVKVETQHFEKVGDGFFRWLFRTYGTGHHD